MSSFKEQTLYNYYCDLQHTSEQRGKYFPLAEEGKLEQSFPEGLPGELQEEFELTGSNRMMIRRQGLGLVKELERFKARDPEEIQSTNRKSMFAS